MSKWVLPFSPQIGGGWITQNSSSFLSAAACDRRSRSIWSARRRSRGRTRFDAGEEWRRLGAEDEFRSLAGVSFDREIGTRCVSSPFLPLQEGQPGVRPGGRSSLRHASRVAWSDSAQPSGLNQGTTPT